MLFTWFRSHYQIVTFGYWIAIGTFFVLPLSNCKASAAESLGNRIQKLVQVCLTQDPQTEEIAEILGGKLERVDGGKQWRISAPGYRASGIIPSGSQDLLLEVSIVPEGNSLRFNDIKSLGENWKTIYQSKTSGVHLRLIDAARNVALDLSVTLAFPPKQEDGPVTRVRLRKVPLATSSDAPSNEPSLK
jgi:hypothetical protein